MRRVRNFLLVSRNNSIWEAGLEAKARARLTTLRLRPTYTTWYDRKESGSAVRKKNSAKMPLEILC